MWSVVDHAALPEAKRFAQLIVVTLVKELHRCQKSLADYGFYLPPRRFNPPKTLLIYLSQTLPEEEEDQDGDDMDEDDDDDHGDDEARAEILSRAREHCFELLGNQKPGEADEMDCVAKDPSEWPEPDHLRIVMSSQGPDSFHADALIANAMEEKTFGTDRGSKGKDMYSSTSAALCYNYHERRGEGRWVVGTRRNDWYGGFVALMPQAVQQRWESKGGVCQGFVDRCKLQSKRSQGEYLLPDFAAQEMLQYSVSQYQHTMLGQVISSANDPRHICVHFQLPIDIHKGFWKIANLQGRSKSEAGAPQGFSMAKRVELVHFTLAPIFEGHDLAQLAPRTMQGIADLRNFAVWTIVDEENEFQRRFPVHQCVAIESAFRAWDSGNGTGEGMVTVGHLCVNFELMIATDVENTNEVSVERKDYLVRTSEPATEVKPPEEAWAEPPTDTDVEENADIEADIVDLDGDSQTMNVDQIADMMTQQLVSGRDQARAKMRKVYRPYYVAPCILLFLRTKGLRGALARRLMAVVKEHRPALVKDLDLNYFECPDLATPADVLFNKVLEPTAIEASKKVTRKQKEQDLADWVCRFDLLDTRLVVEWRTLCLNKLPRDDDHLEFSDAFPHLDERFTFTLDVVCSQDLISEQANSMEEELIHVSTSFVQVDNCLTYFYGILYDINEIVRWLGRDKDEVKAARLSGRSVKLRPNDTHEKVREQLKLVLERLDGRYTKELLEMIPSVADLRKGGTRAFDEGIRKEVLKVAAKKRKLHQKTITPELVERMVEKFTTSELSYDAKFLAVDTDAPVYDEVVCAWVSTGANRFDSSDPISNTSHAHTHTRSPHTHPPTHTPTHPHTHTHTHTHIQVIHQLINPAHWGKVNDDEVKQEVRYVLPHANRFLGARGALSAADYKSRFGDDEGAIKLLEPMATAKLSMWVSPEARKLFTEDDMKEEEYNDQTTKWCICQRTTAEYANSGENSSRMVMCEAWNCENGRYFHYGCLNPPLKVKPKGTWFCPYGCRKREEAMKWTFRPVCDLIASDSTGRSTHTCTCTTAHTHTRACVRTYVRTHTHTCTHTWIVGAAAEVPMPKAKAGDKGKRSRGKSKRSAKAGSRGKAKAKAKASSSSATTSSSLVGEKRTRDTDVYEYERSVLWSARRKDEKGCEDHSKTTKKRQDKPNFIKRQIKGYVEVWFAGRVVPTSSKGKQLEAEARYWCQLCQKCTQPRSNLPALQKKNSQPWHTNRSCGRNSMLSDWRGG